MSETKKAMNYELLFMQAVGLLGVINAHYMCIESYIHNIFNYYTWLMAFFIFLSGCYFTKITVTINAILDITIIYFYR